jgi:hypothetical protein
MPRSNNKPLVNKAAVRNSVLQNRLSSNEGPSFFSTVKQGFGFGIGSSIAHNIFDSKEAKPMPPLPPLHPLPPLRDVIDKTTEFKQCMEKTYNNYEECAPILK